ncbi:ATP-binding cassette domain-containing protein [Streptomyces sp. URMC 126]|uniref:ATP-binding cassette domain-containing protein n=1 Tax=Streptomyces sp. URMC 126 TaxID=3423401 RepID=UPI003F1A36F3
MIEVRNLRKESGDLVAVDDVSFTVEEGEIFGLVGPAGSGKTTALECIEGLRGRDGGEIRVLGRDPHAQRAGITRRLEGRLRRGGPPDRPWVAEALSLYSCFYRDPADWDRLVGALLAPVDEAGAPLAASPEVREQRLADALHAVGNPQVAVFDELTTGLGPRARHDTWELIEGVRASGVTILLATPSMEEAEWLCDRVALLSEGRVATVGTPSGLIDRVRSDTRITFRPSAPLDEGPLGRLPDVTGVTREGDRVTVTGTTGAVLAVTSELARQAVEPEQLRVEQATLEDVFLALTDGEHGTA